MLEFPTVVALPGGQAVPAEYVVASDADAERRPADGDGGRKRAPPNIAVRRGPKRARVEVRRLVKEEETFGGGGDDVEEGEVNSDGDEMVDGGEEVVGVDVAGEMDVDGESENDRSGGSESEGGETFGAEAEEVEIQELGGEGKVEGGPPRTGLVDYGSSEESD